MKEMRKIACCLITWSVAGFVTSDAAERPNIVVIVADDLGYGDLGAYGCRDVPTPQIDSLAQGGLRCTDGYVSCPVCSPTRAGLLTGRYQQRFGHEFNPGPAQSADESFGLPLSEATFADRLKQLGYTTGIVGKWHLGYKPPFHPSKRGFDEFFGFLGGSHSYLDAQADRANPILRAAEPIDEKEYLTDAFGREAVAFIDRHRDKHFFLYLSFNAVHTPMHAVDKYRQRFAQIEDEPRRTFAAMLSAMDDAVGEVLAALRRHQLEDRTLIFFISDNGGPTRANTSRNGPLSGYKGQVLEGGIRVPFLVQWKGRLPVREVYRSPVIALDILPTALAAAGGKPEEIATFDGVNLLPYFAGQTDGVPHPALFWRFGEKRAVRAGDWKLVDDGQGTWTLFNLAEDIGEKRDVGAQHAEKFNELRAAFDAWNKTLAEPRWKTLRQPRQKKGKVRSLP